MDNKSSKFCRQSFINTNRPFQDNAERKPPPLVVRSHLRSPEWLNHLTLVRQLTTSPNVTNFNSPTNFNCINNINNISFNNSNNTNNFNLVSPIELYSIPTRITVRRNNLPKLRPRLHARKVIAINSSSKVKTSSLPSLFVSNSRSLRSKIDELACTVATYSVDVVAITETWLSDDVPSSAVELRGYSMIRHDRSDGRRGGGVCVYVKDLLPLTPLNHLSDPNFETLWLLLKPQRLPCGLNSIILGVIYHPPGNNDTDLQAHVTENLDSILSSHPNSGIILTGDFNEFRHRRLCSSFNLKQIVNHATRGDNILDKVFTNISKYYDIPNVVASLSSSDHNSIVLTPSASYANSNLRSSRFVRDARPSNRRVVRERLCQVNWSPLFHSQSCDDQFIFFSDTINEIIETSLPLRRVKTDSSDKPWITPEIKTLIAKRQRAWSRGNVSTFKRYRNMVNAQCKKARNSYYNKNIADVQQSNPKQWWSAVKKIAGLSTPKMTKTLIYNDCTYQGEDLANLFNDKFVVRRTHLFCVVHYAPFSIRPFVKASFLPCGSQPTFYQFQNLLPPSTSIQTFVLFHLLLFSVKSWNPFPTAGFFSQFQTKSIPSSSVLNEDQAQAWLSSTSCINGTKHAIILDHHYGFAY